MVMLHLVVSLFVVLLGAAAACTASPSQTPTPEIQASPTLSHSTEPPPMSTITIPSPTPTPTPDPRDFNNAQEWEGLLMAAPRYRVVDSIPTRRFPTAEVYKPISGGVFLWVQFAMSNSGDSEKEVTVSFSAQYQGTALTLRDDVILITEGAFTAGGMQGAPTVGKPFNTVLVPGAGKYNKALFELPPGADPAQTEALITIQEAGPRTFVIPLRNSEAK
jgi:hypothetical protein